MKFFALAALFFSFAVCAQTLEFRLDGKTLRKAELPHLKQKEEARDVYNVFRGYKRTYLGRDFSALMGEVYGADWVKKKKVQFLALDGYGQISLVPGIVSSKHKGFLAWGEKGQQGFTPVIKGDKSIDPGPFYLVWDGYAETDKGSHGDNLKWPYQLGVINLTD